MHLQLDEEQTLIRQSARDFLTQAWTVTQARAARLDPRGCGDALWRQMAGLGWTRLLVPDCHGGAGGSFMDVVVLLEETGYACLPGPFFSTAVLGALCLRHAGAPAASAELLSALACGDLRLALALDTQRAGLTQANITVTATPLAGGTRLAGTVPFVADAAAADLLLCPARTGTADTIELYRVPANAAGLRCTPMPSIGGAQFCEIGFTEVELAPAAAIGAPGAVLPGLRRALLMATVAKCAEMIGGAQRVLDTAVTYARDRVQFGRPIGSFQAIQHHCADMLMDLERARWLTYKAAAAIDRGGPDPVLVAKAKVCCNDSYRHIVRRGHQVMGGIGYCEEHEMPLYFRHARMAETAFGDSDGHLASLATQLLGPI